jgi:hypothetical protein
MSNSILQAVVQKIMKFTSIIGCYSYLKLFGSVMFMFSWIQLFLEEQRQVSAFSL